MYLLIVSVPPAPCLGPGKVKFLYKLIDKLINGINDGDGVESKSGELEKKSIVISHD